MRCPSDLVGAQEQLKIMALKVEMQDIDILKEKEVHCNRVQFLFKERMRIGTCMCCL